MRRSVIALVLVAAALPLVQSCAKPRVRYVTAGRIADVAGSSCEFASKTYVGNLHLIPTAPEVADPGALIVTVTVHGADGKLLGQKEVSLAPADLYVHSSTLRVKSYGLKPPLCNDSCRDTWTYTVTMKQTAGKHDAFDVVYSSLVE